MEEIRNCEVVETEETTKSRSGKGLKILGGLGLAAIVGGIIYGVVKKKKAKDLEAEEDFEDVDYDEEDTDEDDDVEVE